MELHFALGNYRFNNQITYFQTNLYLNFETCSTNLQHEILLSDHKIINTQTRLLCFMSNPWVKIFLIFCNFHVTAQITIVVLLGTLSAIMAEFSSIPENLDFSCEGRSYGYYADQQANCAVFHICSGIKDLKWTFLCPNHTMFNQVVFITEWAKVFRHLKWLWGSHWIISLFNVNKTCSMILDADG